MREQGEIMTHLGKMTRVDLRKVWADEAGAFTPWLAQDENLGLLGVALGIGLELEAQEKDVGPFRADILCRDADAEDDHWVLIENQLEKTDHTHLGQLMTYAAGLDAVTIIWVAARFTEEHRAALDWLNEITNDTFRFFGVEVELWRIGDSPVAPKFNVIAKPNDWSRRVKKKAGGSGGLSDRRQLQLEYWTRFADLLKDSPVRAGNPRAHYRMSHAVGRSGYKLSSIASFWDADANAFEDVNRVEFVMRGQGWHGLLASLKQQSEAIEAQVGETLHWLAPEEGNFARVYLRKSVSLEDRDAWPDQHAWLRGHLETFLEIFVPRIPAAP